MRTRSKVQIENKIGTGDIILAQPFWNNEYYKRSVILLLEHDKTGSTGIIINKISNLIVHDALPQFNLLNPLFFGGGNQAETVSYIHNFPSLPNVLPLGNGLYYGGEPESLETLLHTNVLNSVSVKFCSGFVEWAADELESELSENKWWKGSINAEELFTMPYERLWAYKLLKSGHLYGIFDQCEDPFLN